MSKEGLAKKMTKEQRLAAKEAVRTNGGIPPSEMASPKTEAESKPVPSVEVPASESIPAAVEIAEAKVIPPELVRIYGDNVPSDKIEMYGKLKDKVKKGSYLKMLRAEEKEKKKKQETAPVVGAVDVPPEIPVATRQHEVDVQREIEEEIEARRADMDAAGAPVAAGPEVPPQTAETKPSQEPVAEGDEKPWSPSPLEEQHSAVLGELYELYRGRASGPFAPQAIPDEVYQKFQEFFDERSKNLSPTDTIPEADVDSFLAEQGAAVKKKKVEAPPQETAPAPVDVAEQEKAEPKPEPKPEPKESSFTVGTEMRDDNLEYVSIIPSAFEKTPFEWRNTLKKLIDKLTGNP